MVWWTFQSYARKEHLKKMKKELVESVLRRMNKEQIITIVSVALMNNEEDMAKNIKQALQDSLKQELQTLCNACVNSLALVIDAKQEYHNKLVYLANKYQISLPTGNEEDMTLANLQLENAVLKQATIAEIKEIRDLNDKITVLDNKYHIAVEKRDECQSNYDDLKH